MNFGSLGINLYFILILFSLFFAFFVSPFFSAVVGFDRAARHGITQVFVRIVRRRREALLLWSFLAFGNAILTTVFLYLIPTVSLPLALLGVGVIIFIYVVELHMINTVFGKGVVKDGN